MNYIKHLTHWFELLKYNKEVKPTHIAIYIVLFQLWNQCRFPPSFVISRPELMNLCKIGSKSIYSNCMADMHKWEWVHYTPSHSKYGASTVSLVNWSEATFTHDTPTKKRSKYKEELTSDMETTTKTTTNTTTDTTKPTTAYTTAHTTAEPDVGHNYKTDKQETINDITNLKKKYNEPM